MRKIFTTLLSVSFLITPIAFVSEASAADHRRPTIVEKKVVVHKYRWTKGHRMTAAERRHMAEVRDYRRYRLSAPPRGHRWVRVDNEFLLIGLTSGIVSSIIAAR
jgi:Ni/Co efflux regulator RcnB